MPTAAEPKPQCQPTRSPSVPHTKARQERAQVDAHVEDGEGAVAPGVAGLVQLADHDRDARLEVAGSDHDERQPEDEDRHAQHGSGPARRCPRAASTMCPSAISSAADDHGAVRAEQLVGDPAADDGQQVREAGVPAVKDAGFGRRPTAAGVEETRSRPVSDARTAPDTAPAVRACRSTRSAPTSRRGRAGTGPPGGREASSSVVALPRRPASTQVAPRSASLTHPAARWYANPIMPTTSPRRGALAGVRVIDMSPSGRRSLVHDPARRHGRRRRSRSRSPAAATRSATPIARAGCRRRSAGLNFQGLNRNKRGIDVDIGTEQGEGSSAGSSRTPTSSSRISAPA